jgi:hypothetical protein
MLLQENLPQERSQIVSNRRGNYLVTFILMPYENIFVDFPETFLQFTWAFVEEQESTN